MRVFLLTFLCLGIILGTGSSAVEGAMETSPKIFAISFYADWCPSCQKLAPTLDEVKNKFSGNTVLFVTFDRTSEETNYRSHLLASALGLEDIFNRMDSTGFVLLVDAYTGEIKGRLGPKQTTLDMTKSLEAVLGEVGKPYEEAAKLHFIAGDYADQTQKANIIAEKAMAMDMQNKDSAMEPKGSQADPKETPMKAKGSAMELKGSPMESKGSSSGQAQSPIKGDPSPGWTGLIPESGQ